MGGRGSRRRRGPETGRDRRSLVSCFLLTRTTYLYNLNLYTCTKLRRLSGKGGVRRDAAWVQNGAFGHDVRSLAPPYVRSATFILTNAPAQTHRRSAPLLPETLTQVFAVGWRWGRVASLSPCHSPCHSPRVTRPVSLSIQRFLCLIAQRSVHTAELRGRRGPLRSVGRHGISDRISLLIATR